MCCLFGAFLVIVVAAPASLLAKITSHSSLVFFGQLSYGLYIFHYPIALLIENRIVNINSFPRLYGSQLPGQLTFIVVAGSASLGLALLSWYGFEQPILGLKRYFPYATQTSTASPAHADMGFNELIEDGVTAPSAQSIGTVSH